MSIGLNFSVALVDGAVARPGGALSTWARSPGLIRLTEDVFMDVRLLIPAVMTSLIFAVPTAIAGGEYFEEVNKFNDIQSTGYNPSTRKDCKMTKALRGRLIMCSFSIIQAPSAKQRLVSLRFHKYNDEWDLLSFKGTTSANSIISFKNGSTERFRLPAKLSADVSGTSVSETVVVYLNNFADQLPDIDFVEVEFGTSQFEWRPDQKLINKSLKFLGG